MSLAFQKLNGSGTIAGAQLATTRLPEIYKIARMLIPDKILTPVWKTWSIPITIQGTIDLDMLGNFFGVYTITHSFMHTGNADNDYQRSKATIFYSGAMVWDSYLGVHGDDILTLPDANALQYTGFASSMRIEKYAAGNENPDHGLTVSMYGYQIGENLPVGQTGWPDITQPDPIPFVELITGFSSRHIWSDPTGYEVEFVWKKHPTINYAVFCRISSPVPIDFPIEKWDFGETGYTVVDGVTIGSMVYLNYVTTNLERYRPTATLHTPWLSTQKMFWDFRVYPTNEGPNYSVPFLCGELYPGAKP